MTPEQFAYWFQGFAELNEQPPTPEQWKSIREHLATVFKKVTPAYAPAPPAKDGVTTPFDLQRMREEFLRMNPPAKIDVIC